MCYLNDLKSYDGVRVVGTEKNGNESENSSRVDKNSKIKKVWEIQNQVKSMRVSFVLGGDHSLHSIECQNNL